MVFEGFGGVLFHLELSIMVLAVFGYPDRQLSERQNLPMSNVQVHFNETSNQSNQSNIITTITLDIDFVHNTTETSIVEEEVPYCGCYCGIPNRKHRIVGGNETKANEYPWIVAMYRRGKFYCAGALITRKHVLTAAHCVYSFQSHEIKVVLGAHDRDSKNETDIVERKLKKATAHKKFDLFTFNNDIALLELDSPVNFSKNIQSACLPGQENLNYTGKSAIIAGWGRVEETKPISSKLRSVIVPIISNEECRMLGYHDNRITENMICAGYSEGKKDACQGDSGGPMVIETGRGNLEIAGIVSWGRGCARPSYPGVYTRVGNYLQWIRDLIPDECYCQRP